MEDKKCENDDISVCWGRGKKERQRERERERRYFGIFETGELRLG